MREYRVVDKETGNTIWSGMADSPCNGTIINAIKEFIYSEKRTNIEIREWENNEFFNKMNTYPIYFRIISEGQTVIPKYESTLNIANVANNYICDNYEYDTEDYMIPFTVELGIFDNEGNQIEIIESVEFGEDDIREIARG